MTVNIAEARTLVERLREFHLNVRGTLEMDAADTIAALLDKVEHWKAEAESWEKQASDRVDDALKFSAERDALARDAARYQFIKSNCEIVNGETGFSYEDESELDAAMKGASDE